MRMPKVKIALPLLAATAALAGCYAAEGGPGYAAGPDSRIPAARVTGPDESCIPLNRINQSHVRDDRTIDFLSSSGRGWRNVLPQDCPSLSTERAFSYNTSLSRLCNTDIIRVLQNFGGTPQPGAACGLGQFTPIELAR